MNENIIQKDRITLGLTFRKLRKEKGLTQKQLAVLCSVTVATMNKVEQGKFAYSIDFLFKLSQILDYTINLKQKEYCLPQLFCIKYVKALDF
jgi:transcriptional regulator with XRE-family HTH domain